MKKNILHFVTIGFVSLLLGSCAPAYVPNVISTPLLSNKGEMQLSVNTGIAGFDPQFAYAVTDYIGVMVNGSFANWTSDSTDNFHKHKFVEIGTGYYTKLGESGRFETFCGFGFGNLKAKYSNDLWISMATVNSTRFFVQPTIGATTKMFDGSFATRIVFVNLTQEDIKGSGVFVEPVLTGKVGYKNVKGVIQLGFSLPFNHNDLIFNYQPFIFSVGLQVNIGKLYE